MPAAWIKTARRLRAKKMSIEAIAASVGMSKSAVHRVVADMAPDLRAATNKARGDIEPGWLDEARRLLKAGRSRPQIAVTLDVAQTSVYRMLHKFGTDRQP
jgi:transposase-like protein